MNEYHLAVQVYFDESPKGTAEMFGEFVACMHEQLEAIEAPVNVAARLTERMVDVAGVYEATNREAAISAILTDVRSALHASECVTAGWPTYTPRRETVDELQDA